MCAAERSTHPFLSAVDTGIIILLYTRRMTGAYLRVFALSVDKAILHLRDLKEVIPSCLASTRRMFAPTGDRWSSR